MNIFYTVIFVGLKSKLLIILLVKYLIIIWINENKNILYAYLILYQQKYVDNNLSFINTTYV